MKYIKHIILTAMAVVVMSGAWAQTSPEKQPNGSWQFTMPAANKLLEVENYNTYTLTLASNDNTMGTVELLNSYTLTFTGVNSTAEPIVIPYYDGDSITLDRTCSQMAQDFFAGYSYNTVSTPTQISCDQQGLTVKEAFTDTLVITFSGSETKTIQVTCTSNMSNVTEIGNGNYTVIDGAVVTVKATPADNYRFVNWTDENSNVMGTAAQMTFTVTGDTAVTGNFAVQESRLDSVRTTWEVYINSSSTAVYPTPYSDTDTMGYVIIPAGADVKITPKPEGQAAMVSKLELIDKTAPSCRRITLDTVQHHFVAQDCDTLTGTLNVTNYPVKISIANGATVTLDNVTIKGTSSSSYKWAGITCLGDATIILKDGTTDTVRGFYANYPGIYVPANSTLTIKGGSEGTGKLIASSNGWGAGIGGGYQILCGNINIQSGDIKATGGQMAAGIGGAGSGNFGTITISGGTINATGGFDAAGIGSGYNANCDTITITGGTIEATGGDFAAGIGSGYQASCSAITITSDVTRVTATKGADVPNSIGAGKYGTCGTVTIGGVQGAKTDSPYTYPPQP